MESYNLGFLCLASFAKRNVCKVYPHWGAYQCFIPFCDGIFHCADIPWYSHDEWFSHSSVDHSWFSYSSVYFFFPHFLAIMNNPAIFAQVFVCSYVSSSLGKIPRSGTAGLDGQFRFNYLKNCQTAFPKWLDHIPSPPAKSISPYLHPVFAIVFLDTTFPVCLNQYLIMILICIPLMTNGVDIFLCLLAICVSWDKCLFKFFFHF